MTSTILPIPVYQYGPVPNKIREFASSLNGAFVQCSHVESLISTVVSYYDVAEKTREYVHKMGISMQIDVVGNPQLTDIR